jgi:Flp pilus assembly protein TadD
MGLNFDNSKPGEVVRLEKSALRYYERNKLKLALNDCQKALTLDEKSASIRVLLSKIFFSLGDYIAAEREVMSALELEPLSIEARNMMSVILMQKGQFTEAQALLQTAIQEIPDFWSLHWNLGLAYTFNKEFTKAKNAHWRAFVLNPSWTSISGVILATARAHPAPLRLLFIVSFFLPIINQAPWSLLFTPVVVGYVWGVGYLEAKAKNNRRSYFFFAVGCLTLLIHILAIIMEK